MSGSVRRLRGFSTPRTRGGQSSLVEPLPHHIAADAVHVEFEADREAINGFLPAGLEARGTGWVMVAQMVKVSGANPEAAWRSPATTNYNECVLGFHVRCGDRLGRYSALVWVDRDWSLGMGPIFGWPKRLGVIDVSRLIPAHPSLRPHGPGATVGGTVSRSGHPVLSLAVHVPSDAERLHQLPGFGDVTFLHRYLPQVGEDVEALDQLMEISLQDVRTVDIYEGSPELRVFDAPGEELATLGEPKVLRGFIYRRGWTTDAVVRRVW